MKRTCVLAMAAAIALSPCSCGTTSIEGSGNVVTETRDVSGFERIELTHMGVVVLKQGDSEALTVQADDNLMKHIVTEVRGGTLRIGFDGRASRAVLRPSAPVKFDVSFKELSGLAVSGSGSFELGRLKTRFLEVDISGSGDVVIGYVEAEKVDTAISGSGEVDIDGRAVRQSVSVSGSGKYHGRELVTDHTDVAVSGSGLVVLHATETLEVGISGSGTVRYAGNPEVTKSISGSGELEPVDAM